MMANRMRSPVLALALLIAGMAQAQWNQLGADLEGSIEGASAGWSVDINADGTVVAVGSRDGWANGFDDAGETQVFEWNGEAWELRGLPLLGEAEYEWLGSAVALNDAGNVLAVGSTNAPNANGVSVGRVQILEWDGAAWGPKGENLMGLENPFSFATFYGFTVDLSADGNTVAIGAPFRWSAAGDMADVGYVEVYDWNGNAWVLRGEAVYGTEEETMWSGFDVALSADGQSFITGAPSLGPIFGETGLVRAYAWNGDEWMQKGQDFYGALPGDDAGRAVSMANNGNTIAFSAALSDPTIPGNDEGEVMVFDWEEDAWALRGDTLSSIYDYDDFGESISLSSDGTRLAVGAPFVSNDDPIALYAGLGTVYEWQDEGWIEICPPILGVQHQEFGGEVAMSGDGSTFIMGAFAYEPNGRARVFRDADWVSSVASPMAQRARWSCYPNPSSGRLTIEGFEGEARLELRTLRGRLVSIWDGCTAPFTLDLGPLANGMYVLQAMTAKGAFNEQIILEH